MTAPCSGTRRRPAISMRRKKTRNANRSRPTIMRLTIFWGTPSCAPESRTRISPARKRKYSRSAHKRLECLCQFVKPHTGCCTVLFRQKIFHEGAQLCERVVGDDAKDVATIGGRELACGERVGDDEGAGAPKSLPIAFARIAKSERRRFDADRDEHRARPAQKFRPV